MRESDNDIAYLKAEKLAAGLHQAEKRQSDQHSWQKPIGYQRHLFENQPSRQEAA
jgi:hypothetical protein